MIPLVKAADYTPLRWMKPSAVPHLPDFSASELTQRNTLASLSYFTLTPPKTEQDAILFFSGAKYISKETKMYQFQRYTLYFGKSKFWKYK